MIRRFLLWLTARLPAREIAHQGEVFMERYYVATLFGWRVYIHRFVASDPDGLHDHPWRYGVSVILSGWYLEERRDRTIVRRWGNMVNGDTFHRIHLPVGGEAWTLFAHTRRCKAWGFLRDVYTWRKDGLFASHVEYFPVNDLHGHSNWHLTAPKGRDIRAAHEMPAVFRRHNRRTA